MNANSQFKEHEITTCCALRFDGYKYRQETGFDPKLAKNGIIDGKMSINLILLKLKNLYKTFI
jgi:hypothetical protein